MNEKNSEAQGAIVAFALIGAVMWFAILFIFAVAAFLSFAFTILAIFAWDRPITIFGQTIHPHEARGFVYGGVAGTFLLPVFAVFAALLFKFQIQEHIWPYLFIGGYVAGSIGVAYLQEQAKVEGARFNPPVEVKPSVPPSSNAKLGAPSQPFEYASWDDEERRP